MKAKILTFVAATVFLFSCGGEDSSTKEKEGVKLKGNENVAMEVCKYSYSGNTTVKWTAFKFTEKVGVGGTLDSMNVKATGEVEEPYMILNNLEFEIYTASVNSKNPDRDKKLTESFFGSMESAGVISGKVMEMDGDANEGTVTVNLTMNGQSFSQPLAYNVKGSSVTISGQINLVDWKAEGSVESLNNVCKDLHTGEDGVSILWPNVDIEVVSTLDKISKSPCK